MDTVPHFRWTTEPRDRSVWRNAELLLLLVAAVAGAAGLIHLLGGPQGGTTYIMLLPVLAGAALYGVAGGIGFGILGAVLIGLPIPGELGMGIDQPLAESLIRLTVFATVGAVAGGWRDRLSREMRANSEAARIDPATGLRNQVALHEELDAVLGRHANDESSVACILLRATDLDDIVDVTGVEGGDHVLAVLAEHLQRVSPETKAVCRFGGSSLALIVEAADHVTLKRAAHALHGAASAPVEVDTAPVRIEPALGIGHRGGEPAAAGELIRRARSALRRALVLEKGWVSYEPAFDTDSRNTIDLIARVETALDIGEFELHYQPKIRLADGQPAGCEALARWRRAGEGIVAPAAFMPKLEKTSLIDQFSRFVTRTATDFARSGLLVPVSINLAPRNLRDEALIDGLIDGLRETDTRGEMLEVEITESALMREPEHTVRLLERLRAHGIGVSIDDFGTGYSSFAYLRRLPASNLKIDRALVRPLEGDAKARRLVLAIIESGHALGMTVTAEGIETEAQSRILADLGCDLGQGFLWSAARPEAELREWLETCDLAGETG